MKSVKEMTYREMEIELSNNRSEMRTAGLERRRVICRRDRDLMNEMDARWDKIGDWYKE